MKIQVEIDSVDNGWIVEDSYYGDRIFYEDYNDASVAAKKIFTQFKKDEEI